MEPVTITKRSLNNDFRTCTTNWDTKYMHIVQRFRTNDLNVKLECGNLGDVTDPHYLGEGFCMQVCETENQNLINKTECSCGL